MKKHINYFVALLALLIATSCSSSNENSTQNKEDTQTESSAKEIYGINGEDIVIRTGPGQNYSKLVNEKATQSLGEEHYCEVDYSTKVEILEEKDGWSKIKVVEPEWLSETYIGWIPSNLIISKEEQEKESLAKLDANEYEIIKTNHNSAVQNFRVYLKRKDFDKHYVYQFIKAFRRENCTMNCNVEVYDSKSILSLIDVYPLGDRDYLKIADHLISISTFDASEVRDWYPYQDFRYKELGGKNWKKEPVK